MFSPLRKPWPLLAILAALTLLLGGCPAEGSAGSAAVSDDSVDEDSTPVAGYELAPRDLSRTVEVSGSIEPKERIRLKSQLGGVLTTVNVEEGDQVRRGQLLAESETSEMRAELRRAEAQVRGLRQRYERKKPLAESNAIQRAEIDDLESEIEVAESEVELWQTRIDLSRIRAPRDAVVTARHVDPGGYVAANEPVLDLADLSTLMLPVRMSERDVVHLDDGESVEVRIDAYPQHFLEATIRRIFPTADPDSRRVTVELAISEIPEDVTVRPGFLARASIAVDRRPEALAVPGESLLASRPDARFVYIIEDDHLVQRDVTVGVDRRNWTEIVDGLEAGDIIVGTNPTNLREGMRVHVSEWVEAQ